MLKLTKSFLDIAIVNATYRRNRFNLPLVDICSINNFGRTIILGFALMDNEKYLSYKWLFEKLEEAWKESPKCIISDECNEIIDGI